MTPQQAKQQFIDQGVTVSKWATDNGFRPCDVYRVLNGFTPCKRGKAHEIAVALGIKKVEPMRIAA